MDEASLDAWFQARVASHDFWGVALVWRNGAAAFSYAGGIAHRGHRVPVTESSRFAVASITKMPVAIAALRLVERGLVTLQQPLFDVLPADQHTKAMTREHTLHHLLSHTTGFANYHDDADPTPASFVAALDRIGTSHLRRPFDMLPLFSDLPAVRPAGEKYEYADANFILAGLVLEAVTGRSWDEVVADEVFQPAGMSDTGVQCIDADPERLAVGYLTDAGPPEHWRANYFSVTANGMPDGGMITTTTDLALLIDALLAGRLLSPPLLSAMTAPQGPVSTDLEQYGYGCELVVEDGVVTIIGHGGADPGVSAMLSHHRAAGTTIVVLCNQDRGSWAATKRLAAAFGLHEPRD
jgi:CubicO group peptidase (beta-lactamase class C family)